MSIPAIRVENLSKQYQIGAMERQTNFREALSQFCTSPWRRLRRLSGSHAEAETIWALKDVSFDVQPGEVVGIIGRNGAGKSTLLKILSQITEPTTGQVEMNGRVGSLLEVGTGFHSELTGRENVFLNGAILGMSRREITRRFDEIVAFSEIEKFVDTPVKRYSSGMYMRLAFAVAAHLEPEVLIVDEVLAVGDAAFQQKCLGKMNAIAREGRTVVFVSHNMSAISALCDRVVVLNQGSVAVDMDTTSGVDAYLKLAGATDGDALSNELEIEHEDHTLPLVIHSLRTCDNTGNPRCEFRSTESISVILEVSLSDHLPEVQLGFTLRSQSGTMILSSFHNDSRDRLSTAAYPLSRASLCCTVPGGLLNGGMYVIEPVAALYNQRWILRDRGRLRIHVVYDAPNKVVFASRRPGELAPLFNWDLVN